MKGWEDKYAIAGTYWPPQYILMDGATLEPLKVVSTRGMTCCETQEFHPEPRVASIVASHYHPEFVVNVKETGHILLVNYEDIKNLQVTDIEGERFLHDGGLIAQAAISSSPRMRATRWPLSTPESASSLSASVGRQQAPPWTRRKYRASEIWARMGDKPSRGRHDLAHWNRPGKASRPGLKVVQALSGQGGGSLFVKAHPKSDHLYVDTPLNTEAEISGLVAVFTISELGADKPKYKVLPIGEWSGITEGTRRVVQGEYNKAGDEVRFSVWNSKNQQSAIVVVDDKTLTLKTVIKPKELITPTGKFNVYNTRNDVY